MSEFGGLSIALSSLQTQQRALEIAANNVANANTAGYTRQAADMTTLGGSATPAIFSTSTGDGNGVTDLVGHAVPRRVHGDPGRPAARLAREPRPGEHDDAAGPDRVRRAERPTASPRSCRTSGRRSTRWPTTPAIPGTRSVLIQTGDARSRRASTPRRARSSQMATSETTQLGTLVTQINTTVVEPGARQPVDPERHGRRASTSTRSRTSATSSRRQLAQLTGATIQQGQNNQVTVSLGGLNLVAENQSQALALDTSGPSAVLRVGAGRLRRQRHVGAGRRDAQRHQHGAARATCRSSTASRRHSATR